MSPSIALNYSSGAQILLTKDSKSNSYVIDINSGNTCETITTTENQPVCDDLMPLFISSQSVSFLNKRTGCIKFFDFRSNSFTGQTRQCMYLFCIFTC